MRIPTKEEVVSSVDSINEQLDDITDKLACLAIDSLDAGFDGEASYYIKHIMDKHNQLSLAVYDLGIFLQEEIENEKELNNGSNE